MGEIEYNTQRKALALPAYGRYVQQMVDYLLTISDKEERTQQAKLVLKVMAAITSHQRNVKDYEQKLWNHLHIMADYKLDVDSGYPKPRREEIEAEPQRIAYPQRTRNLDFYGAYVPKMVSILVEHCPADQLEARALALARQMKRIQMEWHKENVSDDEVFQDLARLSHGKIMLTLPEGESLFDAEELAAVSKASKNNSRRRGAALAGAQRNKRKRSKRKR